MKSSRTFTSSSSMYYMKHIDELCKERPMTKDELCEVLAKSRTAISEVLNYMVRNGYLAQRKIGTSKKCEWRSTGLFKPSVPQRTMPADRDISEQKRVAPNVVPVHDPWIWCLHTPFPEAA